MSFTKRLRITRRTLESKKLQKTRLIAWRREPSIIKLEKPTKIDRARALGYRAKQGFIITRVRLLRGGRKRPLIKKGRRTKHRRRKKVISISYKTIAEQRANRKYPNLEVLNSYLVAKDGKNYWYEIILVDPYLSVIEKDKKINWISSKKHTKRALRGLTSSARKSRGLRKKGKGAEKVRRKRY